MFLLGTLLFFSEVPKTFTTQLGALLVLEACGAPYFLLRGAWSPILLQGPVKSTHETDLQIAERNIGDTYQKKVPCALGSAQTSYYFRTTHFAVRLSASECTWLRSYLY